MTVAAIEALELRATLAEGPDDVGPRFFRRAAAVLQAPWDVATGGDLQLPYVPGPRPLRNRLVNAYVDRAGVTSGTDPRLALVLARVNMMLDPPQALLRPSVAVRVLRGPRRPAASADVVHPRTLPRPRRPEVTPALQDTVED
jgi:hypothetical protein